MTRSAVGPRFSIVTAVYNVEAYLPEFIASVEAQRVDPGELEIVAVDDGSTDGSPDILRAWGGNSRHHVTVFTKPNGGQGSARNLGLEHATGEWVTFTDADDMLDRDFFRVAGRFADAHPRVDCLAPKPILVQEPARTIEDRHPRRWQYDQGNRVADLDDEPNVFLGVSAGSLFRRDRIAAAGLRFDDRIRPNFEDGAFAVRYLLGLDAPRVGLLRDARYLYRKRADGTSTSSRSLRDPGRYTNALEFGYLGVTEAARERLGRVPNWLQQLLIYELSWYLAEDEKVSSEASIAPEVLPRFHALLTRVLRQIDPESVRAHRVTKLQSAWVDLLAHGGRDEPWHGAYAVRSRDWVGDGLQRIQYRFVGPVPDEAFVVDGAGVQPAYAKTRAHRYYGADLLFERVLWLPFGERVEVLVDGAAVPVVAAWPKHPTRTARRSLWPRILAYRTDPVRRAAGLGRRLAGKVWRRALRRSLDIAARFGPWRRRFRGAWLIMDRIHDAGDNGERLFEHLRQHRPEINAWFVIERGSQDWNRLRERGERRLLAHGSLTWRVAMLNCAWLLSSHADLAICRPPQLARSGSVPWRFGFLQHGVIKDDLSRWLNQREMDLFVVSTGPELASVADDGTPYRFSHKETRNTGLPRFDRLLAVGRATPEADRNLVIVAPTWRQWLTVPLASGSQRRALDAAFWESDYIRSWTALLGSSKIADAVARRGWRLGFMPHPNLQVILGPLDLPAHVEPLSFAGVDVQEVYARCALLVTDYSSVAFNTAYIDRPVVYFQFDRDAMLGGSHVGRKGYFDYARDGFGPVADDLDTAELAIVAAIERGPRPTAEYQRRIETAFPVRDGQACARVLAAVEEASRPWVADRRTAIPRDGNGSV
jgi:glycosyltransferase involved in cell wall biosynthesis